VHRAMRIPGNDVVGPPRAQIPCMLLALVAGVWIGCTPGESSAPPEPVGVFTEVSAEVGITHRHHQPILDSKIANIMSWMASVGAAVAAGDYNRDGFVDLFFTNSRKGEPNYLYRNNGDGTFTEVAAEAGLAAANGEQGVSMDAVWGDYDNDGFVDLYLVRWGHDSLYRNDGDGTFTEVSEELFRRRDGTPGIDWANGNAAIFFDYDLDGRLDLYVGNYFREVDLWHLTDTHIMHDDFEKARNAGRNWLFHQEADGTFTEVAARLGVDDTGWTLAVAAGDVNRDGYPDLYCANDFGPDQFFLGGPGGTLTNVTETALGFDTKKGMNADFGDFNNDGWLDLFVTNITTAEYLQEGNMLWYNQGLDSEGHLKLTDISLEAGTYDGGWGWGGKFFDFDNDGDLDILQVNGFISAGEGSYWYDLASWTVTGDDAGDAARWPPIGDRSFSGYEPLRLFRNDGLYSFTEQARALGIASDRDGRGIAIVDLDNDGDLDVVLANQNQEPELFRNDLPRGEHWLTVTLVTDPATGVNRDGIGTRVTLLTSEGLLVRERDGGNGYSGQSDPRLHFGLGRVKEVGLLEVRWPDGGLQYLDSVAVDQFLTVHQDPARYSSESLIRVESPTWVPEDAAGQSASMVPEISPEALEEQLSTLEEHLTAGYDRALASAYRKRAADYGEIDRAITFLAGRVEDEPGGPFAIELSVAYVDKIPTCGGLAAIVCKGTQARKGLDALEPVLAAHPDSWLAWYSQGMNHLHWPRALRHSDDAARALLRCIELQEQRGQARAPFAERVWIALGQAYAKDGRYAEAREAWRQGLELFPASAELAEHLAIEDDEKLAELIQARRSLERRINTDLTFYAEGL